MAERLVNLERSRTSVEVTTGVLNEVTLFVVFPIESPVVGQSVPHPIEIHVERHV